MELVNLVGNIILFYFHLLILCLNLLNYCVRIYEKNRKHHETNIIIA